MRGSKNPSLSTYREKILFIDDSKAQLRLYADQTQDKYEVRTANDYGEAIHYLSTDSPDLIVLDMVMPQVTGLEFLEILQSTPSFANIPVIMVSAEQSVEIVREAFNKGASDYVRKPYDVEELLLRINRTLHQKPRIQGAEETNSVQNKNAKSLMIKALSDLAATRDNETGNHLSRIEKYVKMIVVKAAESKHFKDKIDRFFLETLSEVSVLHDIGKVGIPDNILQKPGPLNDSEFTTMKTHTLLGSETITKILGTFPNFTFLVLAEEIARTHHEKFDGTGYPSGLIGEDIPLSGRIVAIADVFDALTTKRVYKPAFSFEKAVSIMQEGKGSHFDPDLLEIFMTNLAEINQLYLKFRDPV